MKKILLTLAMAITSYFSYSQSYLPLTAGSGSPLTGDLYLNTTLVLNNAGGGIIDNLQGNLLFQKAPSGGFIFRNGASGAYTEYARLSSTGSFLINYINDPTSGSKLAVNGNSYFNGTGTFGGNLTLNGSGTQNGINYGTPTSTNNFYLYSGSSTGGVDYGFGIYDITSTAWRLWVTNSGNVGIGTTNPAAKLQVSGQNDQSIAYFYNNTGAIGSVPGVHIEAGTNSSDYSLNVASSLGSSRLYVRGDGNVGIGTTTPDTKLAVNGTIHTKEVKVDLTGWPDYVFKPTYNLLPLTDVKNYIDKNHHLPEISSEAEIIKNGVNLGEMVKLQTKKIEELTLYIIQQKEENQKLKEEQQQTKQQQDARIAALERALSKLTLGK